MPPSHVHPVLPVEILNEIFSYLDLFSVRRILCVNSLFRALAQPLAYQYGTVTELGFLFPGAQHPYPFSRGFAPGLPVSPFSKEGREDLVEQLRRIDIKRHSHSDCETGVSLEGPRPPFMDVWNIELHPCFPRPGKDDPRESCDDTEVKLCPYISKLLHWSWEAARKVVVKDIPRNPGYFDAGYMDDIVTDTHVNVVYSQPSPCTPEVMHDYSSLMLGVNELLMNEQRRLEIIFWTERPGQAWIPGCKYSTERGRTGTCREEEGTFWSTLAEELVATFIREVVIVNSAAILPAASSVLQHEVEMKTGQARMQAQHAWYFHANLESEIQHGGLSLVEMYEFMTMEDWIKRGDWEDAFTLEEMRPWLDKMQASGAKNSLPSVVHVYRSSPESESELDLDVE